MIIHRTIRFWAALAAAMTLNLGLVLLMSSPKRVSASAYALVVGNGGPQLLGAVFVGAALITLLSFRFEPKWLDRAIMLQAVPYLLFALSFAVASWRYEEANLTGAPIYAWIAVMHLVLGNYGRIHRVIVKTEPDHVDLPAKPVKAAQTGFETLFHNDFVQVLSGLLTVAWVISLFVRAFYPAATASFAGLDTVSVTIFGYFFVRRAVRRPENRRGGSL